MKELPESCSVAAPLDVRPVTDTDKDTDIHTHSLDDRHLSEVCRCFFRDELAHVLPPDRRCRNSCPIVVHADG